MLLIDTLAEEKILAAIRKGELQDLPGEGRPLHLEDDQAIPQELRVAYRLLKNSGHLPAEVSLRRDIEQVEQLLVQVDCNDESQRLRKRLQLLQLRLAMYGRKQNLLLEAGAYRESLMQHFDR